MRLEPGLELLVEELIGGCITGDTASNLADRPCHQPSKAQQNAKHQDETDQQGQCRVKG